MFVGDVRLHLVGQPPRHGALLSRDVLRTLANVPCASWRCLPCVRSPAHCVARLLLLVQLSRELPPVAPGTRFSLPLPYPPRDSFDELHRFGPLVMRTLFQTEPLPAGRVPSSILDAGRSSRPLVSIGGCNPRTPTGHEGRTAALSRRGRRGTGRQRSRPRSRLSTRPCSAHARSRIPGPRCRLRRCRGPAHPGLLSIPERRPRKWGQSGFSRRGGTSRPRDGKTHSDPISGGR